jgi:hypothetical protein
VRSNRELVFVLWCRLTGQELTAFSPDERAAFLARPQVSELSSAPYPELLDAGISSASRGSLPLERWLTSVQHLSRTS